MSLSFKKSPRYDIKSHMNQAATTEVTINNMDSNSVAGVSLTVAITGPRTPRRDRLNT